MGVHGLRTAVMLLASRPGVRGDGKSARSSR
jgi:hypothetical protein